MNIKIKSIDGKLHALEVESEETISDLKGKVSALFENVSTDQVRLNFRGKILKGNRTLQNYNIKNGVVIEYLLAVRSI